MDFLTRDLVKIYIKLTELCNIPKTCFALLKSIQENPDSPYVNNSFYLQAKAKYFFDNFIQPVGEIIGSMKSMELRDKFISSYNKKRDKYKLDAAI